MLLSIFVANRTPFVYIISTLVVCFVIFSINPSNQNPLIATDDSGNSNLAKPKHNLQTLHSNPKNSDQAARRHKRKLKDRQDDINPIASMKVEVLPTKRPSNGSFYTNQNANASSRQKKFKSSNRSFAESSSNHNSTLSIQLSPTGQELHHQSTSSRSLSLYDSNNNNNNNNHLTSPPNPNDVNNNSIQTSMAQSSQTDNWRRDISSVNGTIDLSQYEQNDVDRLYGDALLVYFKNFNELSTIY